MTQEQHPLSMYAEQEDVMISVASMAAPDKAIAERRLFKL